MLSTHWLTSRAINTMALNNVRGDHLHELGVSADGHLERIEDFDYDEIDQRLGWSEQNEQTVSWDDMSAAFSMVLEYLTKSAWDNPADLTMVGARCESLMLLLDPNQSKYRTMADIAAAANCSRAALSKHLLDFKDQIGLAISAGKHAYHRDSCRRAQLAAKKAGIHSSQIRRDRKQSEPRLDAVSD